ncbi:MAG: T9SS type A sorting domain-containing protein [Ignavibacteria bacterium]
MKTLFKTLGMLGLFFILLGNVGWGQVAGDYQTIATSENGWEDISNWQVFTDVWESATEYPGEINDISAATINIYHSLITSGTYAPLAIFIGPSVTLTIGSRSAITILNADPALTLPSTSRINVSNTGTLDISGIIINEGTVAINSGGSLILNGDFQNAGTCTVTGTVKRDLGTFTKAMANISYQTGSTLEYNGAVKTIGDEYPITAEASQPTNLTISLSANTATYKITLTENKIISGTVSLLKGQLNLSTYTLTVNGIVIRDLGTFSKSISYVSANSSVPTLEYQGGSKTIGTTSYEFPATNGPTNLTINLIDNTVAITMGASRTIGGTLSLVYGKLKTNATFTTTVNGILERKDGIYDGVGTKIAYGSTAKLRYIGTYKEIGSEFPVNGYTQPDSPKDLEISLYHDTNTVLFSSERNINGTLTLTKGVMVISTGITFILGSSTSTVGILERELGNNYTGKTGRIWGNFKRWLANTIITDVLFPMGTNAIYRPFKLSITTQFTAGGCLTIKYIATSPTGGNSPLPADDPDTDAQGNRNVNTYWNGGYWTLATDNVIDLTSGAYSVGLNTAGITSGVGAPAKLRVMMKSALTDTWGYLDGSTRKLRGSHLDGGSGFALRGSLGLFSEQVKAATSSIWGIGGADAAPDYNILQGVNPVTLQSFTTNIFGKNINLNWVTESEINNAGFDIERKTLDGNWSKVGYVQGNGTRNTPTNYSYTDRNLNTGKYQYRLKQIDNNGNFEYHNLSGSVEVGVPKNYELSQNYPNPFNPTTKIDFSLPFDSKVNLIIYDLTGREVKTLVNEARQAGYHTVEMNASMLSSGTYFFRIIANANGKDFISTKKMVLVK